MAESSAGKLPNLTNTGVSSTSPQTRIVSKKDIHDKEKLDQSESSKKRAKSL